MEAIRFTVIGTPQPGGSKKGFVHPHTKRVVVVDANANARPWKWAIASAALEVKPIGEPLLDGPLRVEAYFYRQRPKSHYRANGEVKANAPAYPTTKPDSGKLARPLFDALTGVLWRDDSQVVDDCTYKRYGEPARAEVAIWPLDEPEREPAETRQLALVA